MKCNSILIGKATVKQLKLRASTPKKKPDPLLNVDSVDVLIDKAIIDSGDFKPLISSRSTARVALCSNSIKITKMEIVTGTLARFQVPKKLIRVTWSRN